MSTIDLWAEVLPALLQGSIVTLQLSVFGLVIACAVGLAAAAARLAPAPALRTIASTYSNIVRGTPELLQLFLIYFGLAEQGVRLPPFLAGTLWLGLYGGAYASEVFRAGILAIPAGQFEAARSLGLGAFSTARRVVMPQAIAATLPPLTNFAILLLKASSLAYTITVAELMYRTNLAALATSRTLESYVLAAAIYFVLCFALARVALRLESRAARYA